MNKFTELNFYDFSYKGKKLSDFGGVVASSQGLKEYSLLPARAYVTDRPLNSDVTNVYSSSLEPRVFEVPIFFEKLSNGTIRNIARWLDSPTPEKFQWVGDDVYINASLDATDFIVTSISGKDGLMQIKFIAFDPFYYNENLTQHTQTLTSGKTYTYQNNGCEELYPYLTIACNGTIKLEVVDENGDIYTTTNITNITGGVIINSETRECTLLSGASHFAYIDSFPVFPNGSFGVKITGNNLSNMSVEYREKYL